MSLFHPERVKKSGWTALVFLAAGLLTTLNALERVEPQVDTTERKVRDLAKQFAEILTPTTLESQLRAKCAVDCGAVEDPAKGLTVAQKLENIVEQHRVEMARVGAEIQNVVNGYVLSSARAGDGSISRVSMIANLSHILSGVSDPPPKAFVLAAHQVRALIIFDNIQNGTIGPNSSYAALTAFRTDGSKPALSDSTGNDMDGYASIDVKELHSPVQGEIWLLVSGYMTGANGPNCRMRVFAYDGKKFRTVWKPANVWGALTTRVTDNGFVVRGDYYRSNRHVNDHYALAADGLYLMTDGFDLAPPSK